MKQAFIYTKDMCRYCVLAKTKLKQLGYEITEVDGTKNPDAMFYDLGKEVNPTRTFPQIWINGEYVGGHDQLLIYLAKQ